MRVRIRKVLRMRIMIKIRLRVMMMVKGNDEGEDKEGLEDEDND